MGVEQQEGDYLGADIPWLSKNPPTKSTGDAAEVAHHDEGKATENKTCCCT